MIATKLFSNRLIRSTRLFCTAVLSKPVPSQPKAEIVEESQIHNFEQIAERLSKHFIPSDFAELVNHYEKEDIPDTATQTAIETLLADNIDFIDTETKLNAIKLLSNAAVKFQFVSSESLWIRLFESLLDDKTILRFDQFLVALSCLHTTRTYFQDSRNAAVLDLYLKKTFYQDLSNKLIGPETLADLLLLTKLTEFKVIEINKLSLTTLHQFNQIISSQSQLDLVSTLVLATMLIPVYEAFPDSAQTIFSGSSIVLCDSLTQFLLNFDHLTEEKQTMLIKVSDIMIVFLDTYLKGSTALAEDYSEIEKILSGLFLRRINEGYHIRMIDELRVLSIISNSFSPQEESFWEAVSTNVLDYVDKELTFDVQKSLFEGKKPNSEERLKIVSGELTFYYGKIIEIFSCAGYSNIAFWKELFKLLPKFVKLGGNDMEIPVQFLYTYCYHIYLNDDKETWNCLVEELPQGPKQIFGETEGSKFVLENYFRDRFFELNDVKTFVQGVMDQTGKKNKVQVVASLLMMFDRKMSRTREVSDFFSKVIVSQVMGEGSRMFSTVRLVKKVSGMRRKSSLRESLVELLSEHTMGRKRVKALIDSLVSNDFLDRLDVMRIKHKATISQSS